MSEIIDGVTYYTVRFLNYAATDLLGTASVASGGDATALAPKPETIEGVCARVMCLGADGVACLSLAGYTCQ